MADLENDLANLQELYNSISQQIANNYETDSDSDSEVEENEVQEIHETNRTLYNYTTFDKENIVQLQLTPIKQYIFKKFSVNVPIDKYNEKTWINKNEMGIYEDLTDELYVEKMNEVIMYSDSLAYILDISLIQLDDKFNIYIKSMNASISAIIDVMTNYKYTFYPISKYILAYLIKAIKYERRALVYLTMSPHYDISMLFEENVLNESVVTLLLQDFDESTYDILFPDNNMIELYQYQDYDPLFYALTSFENFQKVIKKIGYNLRKTKYSLLHTALHYSNDIAKYILTNPMDKDYFCYYMNNINPLLLANYDILCIMLNHQYCDSEFVKSCKLFDHIVKTFPDKTEEFIKKFPQYIGDEEYDIYPNTLVYLYDQPKLLSEILFSNKIDLNKFKCVILDIITYRPTILDYIIKTYPNKLQLEIDGEKIISYILKFANGIHIDNYIKNNTTLTPYIDILLKNGYDINNIKIDNTLLNKKDNDGYNMFLHICINKPELAIKLIDSNIPLECFSDIYKENNPMINAIFVLCDDKLLLTTIMKFVSNKINLSFKNNENNNILQNTIINNYENVDVLLPYITKEMYLDQNIISLAATYCDENIMKQLLKSEYYTPDLINKDTITCIAKNSNDIINLFDVNLLTKEINVVECFGNSYNKNNKLASIFLPLIKKEDFIELDNKHKIVHTALTTKLTDLNKQILNSAFCTYDIIVPYLKKLTSIILDNICKTNLCNPEILSIPYLNYSSIIMYCAYSCRHIFDIIVSKININPMLKFMDINGYALIHYIGDNKLVEFIKKHNIESKWIFSKYGIKSRISTVLENSHYEILYSIYDYYNDPNTYNEILFKSIMIKNVGSTLLDKYFALENNNYDALYHDTKSILVSLVKNTKNINLSNKLIVKIITNINENDKCLSLLLHANGEFFDYCTETNIIDLILKKTNIDISFLINKYIKNLNIVILDHILSMSTFDKNCLKPYMFLNINENGIFNILFPYITNYEFITIHYLIRDDLYKVKKLISMLETIDFTNSYDEPLLFMCKSQDMFNILSNHKSFNQSLLQKKCPNNKNILMNPALLNAFKNDDIFDILKNCFDNNNKTYLSYISDPHIFKYLIDNNKITKNDIIKQGSGTILHTCNLDIFNIIKESSLYDENILLFKNYKGNTVLLEQINIIGESILNPEFLKITNTFYKKLLVIANNKLQTPLLIAIKNNIDINLFKKYLKNIYQVIDYKGRNIYHYCAKYSFASFKIINNIINDNLLIGKYNLNNETCIMGNYKYSGQILRYLHKKQILHLDMMQSYCGKSSLTNMQILPYIINNIPLNQKIINLINKKKSFLHIVIDNNPQLFKKIIDKYDISKIIPHIFLHAVKINPTILQHILNSKYMNSDIIELEEDGRTCVELAFNFQPKSLLALLKSQYMIPKVLNKENAIGYTLSVEIQQIYKNQKSIIPLLESISLTSTENIPTESTDPHVCDICCLYKKNIRFNPCGHICCVGCAFKIELCHLCREPIKDKTIIFNN